MVQEKAQEEGQAGGDVLAESQYIQWQVVGSGGKEEERQGRHRTGTEKAEGELGISRKEMAASAMPQEKDVSQGQGQHDEGFQGNADERADVEFLFGGAIEGKGQCQP